MHYLAGVKEKLDFVLMESGCSASSVVPNADATLAWEWLKKELGLVCPLVNNTADFGWYVGRLSVVKALENVGCSHVQDVERLQCQFLEVSEVKEAKAESAYKSMMQRFISRFWTKGGRSLAQEEAKESTNRVSTRLALVATDVLSYDVLLTLLFVQARAARLVHLASATPSGVAGLDAGTFGKKTHDVEVPALASDSAMITIDDAASATVAEVTERPGGASSMDTVRIGTSATAGKAEVKASARGCQ